MRVIAGLVSLALSVVAVGACEEPFGKGADSVSCMAFLALQSAAVRAGEAPEDAAALDAAGAAWRTLAEQKYTADELAQYYASSVAVFDEVDAAQLELWAAACAATAPQV